MKPFRFNRRRFLATATLGVPALAVTDAFWIEPRWLAVRRISLSAAPASHRLVHFSDVHFKGDAAFLRSVVQRINDLAPDVVCFTGDIVEEAGFLDEALTILGEITAPLYGVPGNHDHWSGVDFEPIKKCFTATGGAWLVDEQRAVKGRPLEIAGMDRLTMRFEPKPGTKNILLTHYPAWADQVAPSRFDVILAGHSHGGQVRLPLVGALIVPFDTGHYERGLYRTPSGPLCVSTGVGWFLAPVRFGCRPEITLIEM